MAFFDLAQTLKENKGLAKRLRFSTLFAWGEKKGKKTPLSRSARNSPTSSLFCALFPRSHIRDLL